MKKPHVVSIPETIQKYITLQVKGLLRSSYFSIQDKEDLMQELFLFYMEKLQNLDIDNATPRFNEGFFFIAIKTKALEILRAKRRFNHYAWKQSQEELQPVHFDEQKDIENRECINQMMAGLNRQEQRILMMIMGGANIRETAKALKVSKNTIYKILGKLKKNFTF